MKIRWHIALCFNIFLFFQQPINLVMRYPRYTILFLMSGLLIFNHKYGENFGFEEEFRGAGVEGLKYGNKG